VQIDTIEQRSRDPAAVPFDAFARAAATAIPIAEMTARAWIHRRDELKARRELGLPCRA
jgi:hypothetical protein